MPLEVNGGISPLGLPMVAESHSASICKREWRYRGGVAKWDNTKVSKFPFKFIAQRHCHGFQFQQINNPESSFDVSLGLGNDSGQKSSVDVACWN